MPAPANRPRAASTALIDACSWPAAATPTPGSRRTPADGWSAQYGDAANSSYTPVAGAEALRAGLDPLGQGRPRSPGGARLGRLSRRQRADRGRLLADGVGDRQHGRQRWCSRLWQGGGSSSPLFDGFDNLYVGQPGAMLSFPPTQWIRWRKPVIGLPHDATASRPRPAAGGDAPRSGAGVRRAPRHGRRHAAGSGRGRRPHRFRSAGSPTASRARRGCPVAAAPAFSRRDGHRGGRRCGSPDADAPDVVGLRYRPGQTPLLSREWTSTAVGGGPLGQPGAVRRRQRPSTSTAATSRLWALEHRGRHGEVVGAAGVPAADPAVGVAGRR